MLHSSPKNTIKSEIEELQGHCHNLRICPHLLPPLPFCAEIRTIESKIKANAL